MKSTETQPEAMLIGTVYPVCLCGRSWVVHQDVSCFCSEYTPVRAIKTFEAVLKSNKD